MEKKKQFNTWYIIIAMLVVLFIQNYMAASRELEKIPYSEFEKDLEAGLIERVEVSDQQVVGKYKTANPDGRTRFVTNRVPEELAEKLSKQDVEYGGVIVKQSWITTLLSWILPVLIFFGLWIFLMRKMGGAGGVGGGFMNVGKSKAKVYVETDTGVTFDDVAGVDEAKAELVEVVNFLRSPGEYGRLGAKVPKGVLLVGPPGTGKTLMARAVAGQAAVPFYSISGSEFVEMFVGVGAARVRDLFEQARKNSPAIIFIDELDALGAARGAGGFAGSNSEREQTLNQLLVEMDGFDASSGLVLLAATNRPEILDPALLRAGRFDRQVLVDRPDKSGRIAILEIHLKKIERNADIDPEQIAALTPGFTGADLANLVNEAALLATRRDAESVALDDFNRAIERIIAGLEKKNRLLNELEREVVAYHEMGHALVAMALPGSDPVHKISIIPRGIGALGYTIQRPTEDRFLMTRRELEHKIAVLLGGRAAEKLVFDHLSTGASDDISKATDIARSMVTRYGMDDDLGFVAYEQSSGPSHLGQEQVRKEFSDQTAQEIDESIREIITRDFKLAMSILERNRGVLEHTAKTLLERETLDENDLAQLTENLVVEDSGDKFGRSGAKSAGAV